MCLVCVCVFLKKIMKRMLFYLRREKKKEKNKGERQSDGPVGEKKRKKKFSFDNGSHDFQFIYKKTT